MANWKSGLELLNSVVGSGDIPRRLSPDQLHKMPEGVPYGKVNDTYYPLDRIRHVWSKGNRPKAHYERITPISWQQEPFGPATEVAFSTPRLVEGRVEFGYHAPGEKIDGWEPKIDVSEMDGTTPIGMIAQDLLSGIGKNVKYEVVGTPLLDERGVISELKNFKNFVSTPSGAGLYTNHPASGSLHGKRVRLYKRAGFKEGGDNMMVLDARRRYGKPETMDELYRVGDNIQALATEMAQDDSLTLGEYAVEARDRLTKGVGPHGKTLARTLYETLYPGDPGRPVIIRNRNGELVDAVPQSYESYMATAPLQVTAGQYWGQ